MAEDGNAAISAEAYSENSQGSIVLTAGGGDKSSVISLFASDASGATIDINAEGVFFTGLPTVNPNVAGQLWNDAGTLKVSAG